LEAHRQNGVQFHALRTRQAGADRFVSMHVLVPGAWTVRRGHELLEQIEADIVRSLPGTIVFTHLEALSGSASGDKAVTDSAETPGAQSPAKQQ
jgi:divalent metal cation (Fe/Co/Zn/Cd) transporter